jgi:DNA-binding transcriptional ArsR family regulator
MHRLSDDGILTIRKDGRIAQYELNSTVIPHLEKYLPLYLDETGLEKDD